MVQRIFISAVSREFGRARDAIADRLRSRGLTVEVQSAFAQVEGTTLAKLHDYIKGCHRVLALVGDYSGAYPPEGAVTPEFRAMVPEALAAKLPRLSYTQWEVIFALHYRVPTFRFESAGCAPEDAPGAGDDGTAQAIWRAHLFDDAMGLDRRPFSNADRLAAEVMSLYWPVAGKPCNLPSSIGHLFKGRGEFLDQLTESFRSKSGAAAIVGTAMHGLGGVGKTRAAVEYGYARQDDYSALFFLVGKSPNDLTDGLANLCGVLELGEKDAPDLNIRVAAVVRWLKANPGWLLVIDNVDDEAAAGAVQKFLDEVASGKGHVLITSRLDSWGVGVEALPLNLLSLDAAMELLRAASPNRKRVDDEEAALRRLAEDQLGCLSLALMQAGAHIEARRISFAKYSEEFDKQAATLLAKFGPAEARRLAYPMAVAQTWLTSFEQLGEEARLLLDMLAWLSIEPLPRSLWEVWPKADEIDLEQGLVDLARYSFVRWEGGNEAITVHRLVQEVARDLQSRDLARTFEAQNSLVAWLWAADPKLPADDVRSWPVLMPLLPHVLRLFEKVPEIWVIVGDFELYEAYGLLLVELGRFVEAEWLLRKGLNNAETFGNDKCIIVASILDYLSRLMLVTNRLVEAYEIQARALAIAESEFGDHDLGVARYINNLAGVFCASGRLTDAEQMYRRALAIEEANFGPDHQGVALVLCNFANVLRDTNRLGEAEPLYRRALKIDEASFGPDHPFVAIRLSSLASLLQDTKRLDEAGPLYRRALAIDEASYGVDHPVLAMRQNNLAVHLTRANHLDEAGPLYRRSVLILLRASKACGHLLPHLRPGMLNYQRWLIEIGRSPEQIAQTIDDLMIEGGFDPAELWPHILGDGSDAEQADANHPPTTP